MHDPQLFEYHNSQLDKMSQEKVEYTDFYSGPLISDLVVNKGGAENMRHDIFLFLSADGAQPYTSELYDFWPVILLIGNLPPRERCKIWNMLPIICIPGP